MLTIQGKHRHDHKQAHHAQAKHTSQGKSDFFSVLDRPLAAIQFVSLLNFRGRILTYRRSYTQSDVRITPGSSVEAGGDRKIIDIHHRQATAEKVP